MTKSNFHWIICVLSAVPICGVSNHGKILLFVKTKLDEIRATSLPPGVTIEPFYDRSWLIQKTMKTVFSNLIEGAMLVCLVLFIFLGNFRAAAIVALVIPLSLLGTFIGLTIVGIPANLHWLPWAQKLTTARIGSRPKPRLLEN